MYYFCTLQALSPVGAMFGGLVAWPLSDMLGRQAGLMLSGVPALVGWLMIALAHLVHSNVHAFYGVLLTGRTLTGFSSGWSVFCVSVGYSPIRLTCRVFYGNMCLTNSSTLL